MLHFFGIRRAILCRCDPSHGSLVIVLFYGTTLQDSQASTNTSKSLTVLTTSVSVRKESIQLACLPVAHHIGQDADAASDK